MRLLLNLFDFRNFETFYLFDDWAAAKLGAAPKDPTLYQSMKLRLPSIFGPFVEASLAYSLYFRLH
jgi:hypothetical protein